MFVQLFIPCFVDQLFPQTAFNMVKVLEKLGCQISYNADQTCCGQPAFNGGYWEESGSVAKKFINDFDEEHFIVTPSGSCAGFVRNYYHKLLRNNDPFSAAPSSEKLPVQEKIVEFTEFVTEILQTDETGAAMDGIGTYHDACGALRECNIREAPRKLLSKVKGLELREAADCETCCGFGGTFAVKYGPISTGMAEQKIISAMETGAEYIISTDISCLMHLEGYIKKHKYPITTMHIADVLAAGW